ncbi:MAG: hypothetical protein RL648_1390 [Verrucomicrobiota bacterium]
MMPKAVTASGERRGLILLAVYLVVPHLAWVGLSDYGLLKDSAVLFLAAVWIAVQVSGGELKWDRFWAWGVGLLLVLALPLPWAPDPGAGVGQIAQWSLLAISGIASGRWIQRRPGWDGPLLWAICLGATGTTLHALAQFYLGVEWPDQVRAPAAAFSNRNMTAHWLVVAWPAAVALTLTRSKQWERWAALIPGLLIPAYIVISGSKAGLLALTVQALVLLWLWRAEVRFWLGACGLGRALSRGLLITGAAVSLAVLWFSAAERMQGMGERYWRSGLEESIRGRLQAVSGAVQLVLDRPLGVGAAQFERLYPLYEQADGDWTPNLTRRQGALHNDWLQVLMEGGVLLIPFLVLGAGAYARELWRSGVARPSCPSSRCGLSVFAKAGLAGLAVLAAVSFPWQSGFILFATFQMAGLLSEEHRRAPVLDRVRVGLVRRWTLVLLALSLVTLVGVAQLRQVMADGLFFRQAGAFARGESQTVERLGEEIQRWWPKHPMAADLLGRTHLQSGNFAEAERGFVRLRQHWPNDPGYQYHEALALAGLGRSEEAERLLRPLVQRYPKEPRLHFLHGAQLFSLGDYNRAYVAFHEAARLEPTSWLYVHNVGVAAERAGWRELAIQAYAGAHRLDPEQPVSRERLEALQGER